jgi:hypothetical protein
MERSKIERNPKKRISESTINPASSGISPGQTRINTAPISNFSTFAAIPYDLLFPSDWGIEVGIFSGIHRVIRPPVPAAG